MTVEQRSLLNVLSLLDRVKLQRDYQVSCVFPRDSQSAAVRAQVCGRRDIMETAYVAPSLQTEVCWVIWWNQPAKLNFLNNVWAVTYTVIMVGGSPVLKTLQNLTVGWVRQNPTLSLDLFVIKPARYNNFTNLFCHETLLVSDSSPVHHQEFIHCTLSNGTCYTGL